MATKTIDPEVMNEIPAGTPTEIIAQGGALTKLENLEQMQIARQQPRDEKAICEELLKEVEDWPEAAEDESMIYCRDVGVDPDTKERVYAEDLGIRAAENIAGKWQNSSAGFQIASEGEEAATVVGVFLDYQRNIRKLVVRRVSRYYKQRNTGKMIRLSDDRFSNAVLCEGSKAVREAILRSLPLGLKMRYKAKIREVRAKNAGPLGERRLKMATSFSEIGVTTEMIEVQLGKAFDKLTSKDLDNLRGVYAGIKDGQQTVAEAFPRNETEPAPIKPPVQGAPDIKDALKKKPKPAAQSTAPAGAPSDPAQIPPSAGTPAPLSDAHKNIITMLDSAGEKGIGLLQKVTQDETFQLADLARCGEPMLKDIEAKLREEIEK